MRKVLLLLLLLASPLLAARDLREDHATQVEVKFVDATDGVTAETGLTVTNFDCILIKHADSGMAATALTVTAAGGGVNDAAHLADGVYSLELTATDTGTAGRLMLHCQCSGAAPFEATYNVLPQITYDQRYTGDIATVADVVAGVWEEPVSASFASGTAGYTLGHVFHPTVSGTADSGSTTTVVDAARTEADTDYWAGQMIVFTSGTMAGQARYITGFTTASDTITFAPALTQAASTETYEIWPALDYLRPTTSGRTVDITATGAAGVDFGNIEGGLGAAEIDADAIGADEIAANAIGASELAADAIGDSEIATGAIATTAFAAGAIDAAAIATDAIGAAEIAADAIAASEIATDAIGDAEIATGAIAATAFAAGAIDASAIAADAIGASELATDAIGDAEIATGAVASTAFAAGAIDAAAIATDAIGSAELAASAIGASELATDAIGDDELATGAIASTAFAAGAIDASSIAADAIGASELATNAIGAAEVADAAIDAATFAAGAIDATAIATDAIGAAELAADAIGASELAAPAADEISDDVWDESLSGHAGAGSAGEALEAAGTAGDPWSTSLPGAYGSGTAGFILGTNLDALISSRLAPTTSGRTLDVTVGGEAGLDLSNTAGVIDAAEIGADAITAAKVADGTIDAATFASGAIDAAAVAADAIGAAEIAANAIGASEVAADAIGAAELADGAVDAAAIADSAIDAATFAAGAVDASAIAADAVGASEIAADAIASSEVATTAVTEIQTGLLTVPKNVAYSNFTFAMYLSATGAKATGLNPTCTISKDGAAFAACANAASEIGSTGIYKVNLTQTEMNADEIWITLTGTLAKDVDFKVRTLK